MGKAAHQIISFKKFGIYIYTSVLNIFQIWGSDVITSDGWPLFELFKLKVHSQILDVFIQSLLDELRKLWWHAFFWVKYDTFTYTQDSELSRSWSKGRTSQTFFTKNIFCGGGGGHGVMSHYSHPWQCKNIWKMMVGRRSYPFKDCNFWRDHCPTEIHVHSNQVRFLLIQHTSI